MHLQAIDLLSISLLLLFLVSDAVQKNCTDANCQRKIGKNVKEIFASYTCSTINKQFI